MNPNNGNSDASSPSSRNQGSRGGDTDELIAVKRALLKAELQFAKARATMASAEIDVRVLTSKLRTLGR